MRVRQYLTALLPGHWAAAGEFLMVTGNGFLDRTLTSDEIRQIVSVAAGEMPVSGRRILVIIPDSTRSMPMPLMFKLLQEEIGSIAAACDFLVALGTHPLMRDMQLSSLVGEPVVNGTCGKSKVMNHRWDQAETFMEIGRIPQDAVNRISGGLLDEPIPVRINRTIFNYDQILICGPVFPHEVVGFSGGNKYLFPGVAGPEVIGLTHWLGALLGSYELIGTHSTPVRELIDMAADLVKVPVACMALVVTREQVSGMYFGTPKEAWGAAANLSGRTHIVWVDQPFRRVLSVMPQLYDDMWTAAKGMYKVEPAVVDGGEVIIYAPHISEVSYTHGVHLDKIGYHCRDFFLKQWQKFKDVPRSVLAHSTHLYGKGTYDAETGIEEARITVTLATGIPEDRCRALNLNYLDPNGVDTDEWQRREDQGMKVVPRAGETLYRLRTATGF
ncbi:MAG TPA: lactate racemase domain-containing protein [Candidatus Eisenbacteria bacterium]|nr:lactate racemase domain-containing protein [Candidatus Eisenbacteria bacterium]